MKLIIDIPEWKYKSICEGVEASKRCGVVGIDPDIHEAIYHGTPLTSQVLADALMEERIRGKLNSDTTFEKDIIRDVKCRLTVSIIDHRPCYCGAELREVWRESEE